MSSIKLAVNGTLMRGLALNRNLIESGASFLREAKTEPCYRIWSINDVHPAMQKAGSAGSDSSPGSDGSPGSPGSPGSDGAAISLEVWDVPHDGLVSILSKEPAGLTVGRVRLADGEEVLGVLGEQFLCEGQREITHYGGWREYLAQTAQMAEMAETAEIEIAGTAEPREEQDDRSRKDPS